MDPLEFFPPEISLQCILDILPPQSHHYSHTILELASVSRRWQDFILSAPILWVEINVEHTINDLLAIISVFLTFSRALSLKIIIWGELGESWKDVCSLLLPHTARISTLVHASKPPSALSSSYLVSALSNVISSLGQLPNLIEVHFCDKVHLDRSQIKSMGLPPETRITSRTHAEVMDIGVEMDQLSHLTNLSTFYTIEQMIPVLRWLPNLTEIRFEGTPYEYHGLQTTDENPLLPSLKTLLSKDGYSRSLDKVIQNSASQLCSLSVLIRAELELPMLLVALRSLSKLQELHLDIFLASNRYKVGPYPEYGDAIPSLHTLSVRTTDHWSELALDINPWSKLFTSLEVIYPHAKKVTLEGTIGVLKLAHRYLQGLLSVQSLHLETSEDKTAEIPEIRLHLPSLHVLWASGSDLQGYLEIPNLLHLVVWQVKPSAQPSELSFLQLRRLEVQTFPSYEISTTLTLDPAKYPALCELKIHMTRPLFLWELTSFPNLTLIHLSSPGLLLIHANRLFMTLIYEPTICPSLQHIQSEDFVEWDLLFLMLQRRNFGNTGIKPINELIISFVPLAFRVPLRLLLEGKSSTVPEDLDMSLVTTCEIICDATIPGCVRCLKYMRPHCSAAVVLRPPPLPNAFYPPKYAEPPGNLPVETRERLARHHELTEEWRISFTAFQSKCFRVIMCDRAEPVGTSI